MPSTTVRRPIWIVLVGLWAAANVAAQDVQERAMGAELRDDALPRLQKLVLTLYPGLEPSQMLTISTQSALNSPWRPGGQFMLRVGTDVWSGPPGPNAPPSTTSLTIGVRMDRVGGVHELWGGLTTRQEQRARIVNLIEQHDEWTDTQALQALRDTGASYGPEARDRLLHVVPFRGLEPFIGRCDLLDARFVLREPQEGGKGSPRYGGRVVWELTLRQRDRAHGEPREYVLLFEPFGGTLIHLSQR
jgi:hypothetical protein